jgi:hypothetical protein
MSRNIGYTENEFMKLAGQSRAIQAVHRRGPHQWVFMRPQGETLGANPPIPQPRPDYPISYDSPPFKNSWVNVVTGNKAPIGFRFGVHWELEWMGWIEGGASGTVAFTLPPAWVPLYVDGDLCYAAPVVVVGSTPTMATVYVTAHQNADQSISTAGDGNVTITLL